jgi:antitoxin VapB
MKNKNQLNEARQTFAWDMSNISTPLVPVHHKERHRTKVFKSGNSLALRIPAGTKLKAGIEMDLVIEDGQILSYAPADMPKRKFNIAKVAGSAKGLNYTDRGDRSFEPRPSDVNNKTSAR